MFDVLQDDSNDAITSLHDAALQLTDTDLQKWFPDFECTLKTRSKRVKDVVLRRNLYTVKCMNTNSIEYHLKKATGASLMCDRIPFCETVFLIHVNAGLCIDVVKKGVGLPELRSALPILFQRIEFMVTLVRDVCRCIQYLHIEDLHHIDLQPEHFVFGSDLRVQLTGLGNVSPLNVPKRPREGPESVYDAPEVKQGASEINAKAADVFSVGTILLEYLFGNVRPEIQNHSLVGPTETVKTVLLNMVHENPNKRPTASQVIYNPTLKLRKRPTQ
ncbi:unnamed protein product [Bursaphelenchus okinawaensis]|uniref:Protein kinase domain-containing protein n=1 Tax=Bursaphelenchus okinawaensis TaxID=465554 RepID=A0A811JSM7_9BILA|nr:unnamed protein product [Bursaphelenchus okinawaensis]CAG9081188.1 unnamed protein product [Bursaphelenchus okinawaensis]